MDNPECNEVLTVKFEWTLRGLKDLFGSTNGNKKSKATKSACFGSSKWQVRTSSRSHERVRLRKLRSYSMRVQVNKRREVKEDS